MIVSEEAVYGCRVTIFSKLQSQFTIYNNRSGPRKGGAGQCEKSGVGFRLRAGQNWARRRTKRNKRQGGTRNKTKQRTGKSPNEGEDSSKL